MKAEEFVCGGVCAVGWGLLFAVGLDEQLRCDPRRSGGAGAGVGVFVWLVGVVTAIPLLTLTTVPPLHGGALIAVFVYGVSFGTTFALVWGALPANGGRVVSGCDVLTASNDTATHTDRHDNRGVMVDDHSEHSLWLTFEGKSEVATRYRDAIADLAAAHADAPVFDPHVTVVGGVSGERAALVETTRSVAADTEPIDVTFGPIRCSTTTHQCVFRLVEPTLELFEVYDRAHDALGIDPTAYNPHLSLIYSDMRFEARLTLAAALDPGTLPEAGRLATLELVATGGSVADWETVETVQL